MSEHGTPGDSSGNDIDGFFSSARTTAGAEPATLPEGSYLDFRYDLDDPMLSSIRGMDYEQFHDDRFTAPFLRELVAGWEELYREPFVGITSDGTVRDGLYPLPAPIAEDPAIVAAAQAVLASLAPDERVAARYPIDAPQWRAWSNPEFVIFRVGVRLENLSEGSVAAIHALLRAALSGEGYARVAEAMALNGFLGDVVALPKLLGERSYWFSLFGDPASGEPWGFQLFGHHVAVNLVSVGGHHVIAPVFLGAEPALSGGERTPIFDAREALALELVGSLTPSQRAATVIFDSVLDPAMPEGRVHPADERHVAGAFRDNRVVPFEGIRADALDDAQRALVLRIAEDFLLLLRDDQRERTLGVVADHLDETYLSWYGATDGTTPFYLRIHSPVLIAELDHHAGVWLNNRTPARFHVHTTLRHPNGGDYGHALRAQWGGVQNLF